MGQRMFVAITPPDEVLEHLSAFLEPREQHPWIRPEQWHLTLAFLADVPDHRQDELAEVLVCRLARRPRMRLRLSGAGAFPDPTQAKVLWMDVEGDLAELRDTARTVRHTCNTVGATPDGQRFRPHLSVSRLRRAQDQRRWLEVLHTYDGPEWEVEDVALVASHLGRGDNRPRHETVIVAPLGEREDGNGSAR